MRIGYACLTVAVPDTDFHSCTLKNANENVLTERTAENLRVLSRIIDYNIANEIKLFRISSDLIPFASHSVNKLPWWDQFAKEFAAIGEKIIQSGMRVSMHPGQYTVLNSPDDGVVERAVEDLRYHARVLDSLGVGPEHKIILHIGGVYQDKELAMQRFVENYKLLPKEIRRRLVIENDDRSYTIEEVLSIGHRAGIPVVYDNLHHAANPCYPLEDRNWVEACRDTWGKQDGPQKVHYSQQDPGKKKGAHSAGIRIMPFLEYCEKVDRPDLDVMLEVKDKNLSAIKCINVTFGGNRIKALEVEWSRYKYTILEHSQELYRAIRVLLKDKENCSALAFYQLVEQALDVEITTGNAINAASHVWGYFKDVATPKEKEKYLNDMEGFEQGTVLLSSIKKLLWRLSVKYEREYLLNSYYFYL